MRHNSYLYQYQIQMHLEYILFISLSVPTSKLGISSFVPGDGEVVAFECHSEKLDVKVTKSRIF